MVKCSFVLEMKFFFHLVYNIIVINSTLTIVAREICSPFLFVLFRSIFVAIVRKENLKAVHIHTYVISHFLIKVTVAVARLNRNATSPLPLGHCPVNCEQSKQFVNIMGVKLGR
ncbi:Vacuolar protein sorting-associated protein [Trichinella spiralis]|uniref:Vacuolar protein sorting-associated protein n=1 Tax=Trichinella spiralis TaxID=6334 RepID=A0ABR3K652_TRISP